MVFPPGQGKMGQPLMQLWRGYLEQYAEGEGNVERQIIAASYNAAEIFGVLSKILDREERNRALIEQRTLIFQAGKDRASAFDDCLLVSTYSLYNNMNTLCRQFTSGSPDADRLMQQIDEQMHLRAQQGSQANRSALAFQAAFPLLSLMVLVLSPGEAMMPAVRQVEHRFTAGAARAASDGERLLNALYRMVEMMQIMAVLSDNELRDQVEQIASRFKEEDETPDLQLKLRNGFCRLFELGHILATHLDAVL